MTPEQTQQAIVGKAFQALATNRAYLGVNNPTAAQNTAQVKALTRQVQALLRLTVGAFDDDTTDV